MPAVVLNPPQNSESPKIVESDPAPSSLVREAPGQPDDLPSSDTESKEVAFASAPGGSFPLFAVLAVGLAATAAGGFIVLRKMF